MRYFNTLRTAREIRRGGVVCVHVLCSC